jgi:hypothetical protein
MREFRASDDPHDTKVVMIPPDRLSWSHRATGSAAGDRFITRDGKRVTLKGYPWFFNGVFATFTDDEGTEFTVWSHNGKSHDGRDWDIMRKIIRKPCRRIRYKLKETN